MVSLSRDWELTLCEDSELGTVLKTLSTVYMDAFGDRSRYCREKTSRVRKCDETAKALLRRHVEEPGWAVNIKNDEREKAQSDVNEWTKASGS